MGIRDIAQGPDNLQMTVVLRLRPVFDLLSEFFYPGEICARPAIQLLLPSHDLCSVEPRSRIMCTLSARQDDLSTHWPVNRRT